MKVAARAKTSQSVFERLQEIGAAEAESRAQRFVEGLWGNANFPRINGKLQPDNSNFKTVSAVNIDNWIDHGVSRSNLRSGLDLNRVAFWVWRRLMEAGVDIKDIDKCRYVPFIGEMQKKIERVVEGSEIK